MDRSPNQNQYFDKALETMGWEARKSGLNRKFKTIFRHAFEYAGAYREMVTMAGIDPSQIRGLGDIEKLPILRMKDLVERQKASPPYGELNTVGQEQIPRIYVNPGLIWQPGSRESEDTSWAEALCSAGFRRGDILINTFNYHQGLLAFMLDKNAMRIVVNNLFDNAIKYSPNPAKIMVVLSQGPKYCYIFFSDEGVGISLKEQPRIFNKFERIYNRDNPSVTGTGLGLYWVRQIIDAHGGTISVSSKGQNKGATFKIALPIYRATKKRYINYLLKVTKRNMQSTDEEYERESV